MDGQLDTDYDVTANALVVKYSLIPGNNYALTGTDVKIKKVSDTDGNALTGLILANQINISPQHGGEMEVYVYFERTGTSSTSVQLSDVTV